MKKTVSTLSLMAFLSALSLSAADTALRLSLADGRTPTFLLSERPTVTFGAYDITVKSPANTITLQRSEIQSLDFVESTTAIADAGQNAPAIRVYDNTVECEGQLIRAYNLNGQKVAESFDRLSLTELPPAVYIISVSNHSFKLSK